MSEHLPNMIGELTSSDRRSSGLWVSQISYYLMWFEYLAISPSYELARRYRAGQNLDEYQLPEDFDSVLAVYDDLGDVQKALFRPWWRGVGLKCFGYQGQIPTVTKVGYVPHTANTRPDLREQVEAYFEHDWIDQGRQRTILLAIPVGLPEGKINRQVKKHLARIKSDRRQLIEAAAKYPIVGKRHHKDALMRYLRTVWLRSAMYKQSLWRVGAQARTSATYSPVLDPKMEKITKDTQLDREMLTIITSRALLRARLIAENAARGRFPTHEKCASALEFDYRELRQRIHRRNQWQSREVERLVHEHREQSEIFDLDRDA